jgi:hypothetical protein
MTAEAPTTFAEHVATFAKKRVRVTFAGNAGHADGVVDEAGGTTSSSYKGRHGTSTPSLISLASWR